MQDVSIIIPNYNRGKYLGRCLRSCLKQNIARDRFEIIVIDDASTDESKIILDGFKDEITTIYLPENKGQAYASNEGIKKARGTFIYRLDSDDYISENTILFLTEILLNNPDIGFVYGDCVNVDEDEGFLERVNIDTIDKLFSHGAGIMFRKSYLERIGLYNEEMRHADDYDLLKRYFKNFDGYRLPMPFYKYRQSDKSITRLGKRDEYIKKSDNNS